MSEIGTVPKAVEGRFLRAIRIVHHRAKDRFDCLISRHQSVKMSLFDLRVGNSNLAKSLGKKSNHAMCQAENSHRGLLSSQNYQNQPLFPNFSDLNTRN